MGLRSSYIAGLVFSGMVWSCSPSPGVPDSLEKAGETVWIEGGEFDMGHADEADASPIITQKIDGFWMQRYEVTNAQFEAFTAQTGYITQAEKTGGSYVFDARSTPDSHSLPGAPWWNYTPKANWRHPEGQNSNIQTKSWNPVTHVAYADACAYCEWLNMRLPTEAEREYVARMGENNDSKNTWQGNFPYENKNTDGFMATSPVGSFPPDKNGLYDLRGNVWEWCADPYHAYAYRMAQQLPVAQRNQGPKKGYDPSEPYGETRVIRGGSYLCSESYCTGYLPYTRMRSAVDLTFGHIGFRCVRSEKR